MHALEINGDLRLTVKTLSLGLSEASLIIVESPLALVLRCLHAVANATVKHTGLLNMSLLVAGATPVGIGALFSRRA